MGTSIEALLAQHSTGGASHAPTGAADPERATRGKQHQLKRFWNCSLHLNEAAPDRTTFEDTNHARRCEARYDVGFTFARQYLPTS